ncbi:amidohydrolase family protein [Achromobacter aegrifaciens]
MSALAALPFLGGCPWVPRSSKDPQDSLSAEGLSHILTPHREARAGGAPAWVVDTHAHFFNASDVPVEGFLAGPVAHSRSGVSRALIKALAPLAGRIAALAPTADEEIKELVGMARSHAALGLLPEITETVLHQRRAEFLIRQSASFFELVRGTDFERIYNDAAAASFTQGGAGGSLGPDTIALVVQTTETGGQAEPMNDAAAQGGGTYREGVVGFVGYMLSYRWMNLLAYQQTFTTGDRAFGVDRVFGSLVDFDYWLASAALSSQESQIALHQLLSTLSNGYMRPLVAYNPWSAVLDPQRVRARLVDAIERRGFVGIKIYPPNGFRPLVNRDVPRVRRGEPSGVALERELTAMWGIAQRLGVPVMAHGASTMGSDDVHDEYASPQGWAEALMKLDSPRVNIGHFGGDDLDGWSTEFAALMETGMGKNLYGDTGYWENLRCGKLGSCTARDQLKRIFETHVMLNGRLMYGSDWHMLAQERGWARYPSEILQATRDFIDPESLFGGNAIGCFGEAARPPAP